MSVLDQHLRAGPPGVPGFLRCEHDHHGGVRKDGSGDIICEQCGCLWKIGGDQRHRADARRSGMVPEVSAERPGGLGFRRVVKGCQQATDSF